MATKRGTGRNDTLVGTASADVLLGLAGNDRLSGLAGNDRLDGGSGIDRLDGGAGNDILLGGAGIDTLLGGLGDDSLNGGTGNDILNGGAGNDRLVGGAGNDRLDGGSGNDRLDGGTGDDRLLGGAGTDTLLGGTGNDSLNGGGGNDVLSGGAGNDTLTGGTGTDTLNGGDGDDTLNGGTGVDALAGGNGNDTYVIDVDSEINTALADAGTDTVNSSVTYVLGAQQENLTLTGSAALNGSGNTLANILSGNSGANVLDGAAGADSVAGAGGNDTLVYDAADTLLDGGSDNDTLLVNGTGLVLNTADFAAAANIEVLDVRGSGANRLFLDGARVASLSDSDVLRIRGDAADDLSISGAWVAGTDTDIEGVTYAQYTLAGATLQVEAAAARLIGGTIELSALDGSNGFRLDGANAGDATGLSISAAGDVNGDGFGDVLIASSLVDVSGIETGAGYVVFGDDTGFSATLNLGSLNGSNGFRIAGLALGDGLGRTISAAGDVNGDGFDDVLVGASGLDVDAAEAGGAYVLFGGNGGFAANFDVATLNGINGFRLDGVAASDGAGVSVSAAGDVNGDGFADLMIGALYGDSGASNAGSSYVVFGAASFVTTPFLSLADLTGTNGFRIDGVAANQQSGTAVSNAGDINGDGLDDMVVSGRFADALGDVAGAAFVVFGRDDGFAATVSLSTLNGTNGFRLDGVATGDVAGIDLSAAGDINGDGVADLIVGAPGADPNGAGSGSSYVVFGNSEGFSATLALSALNGSNGFRLDGVASGDDSGRAVSAAGDVNGDGFDDLLVGANGASPHGSASGTSYLLFGQAGGFGATLALGSLTGLTGMRLEGVAAADNSGTVVSAAGDVNGDGYDDMLVAAPGADPNGSGSGSSYVVFGRDFTAINDQDGGAGDDILTGTSSAERIIGGIGNDTIDGAGGADVLRGGAGNDIFTWRDGVQRIDGGSGSDTLRFTNSGGSFITGQSVLRNLDVLDLSGGAGNSVVLDVQSVRSLSDAPHLLTVSGDSDDLLNLAGSWTNAGEVLTGFTRYTAGGISVDVDTAMQVLAGSVINLSALDGSNGFRMDGTSLSDLSGISVSAAGDVNGDGFADLLIGASAALVDKGLAGTIRTGASYVVFGAANGFASALDLATLDGTNGFRVEGESLNDRHGFSVSSAGDVNSDGFADILVGSYNADSSHVVFGKASAFAASIDISTLDGSNGFTLAGSAGTYSGFDVSTAGDINGDGFDDLVIGASGADNNGTDSGSAFVVFGKENGFSASINLASLNGATGFRVNGLAGDNAGISVSSAGDINGDGFDDLMVGALFADPNADKSGASYVVFGKSGGFTASISANSLNGSNGFRLAGDAVDDRAGRSVSSAGDINGDGFDDMLVGAFGANPNGNDSGTSYVVFGKSGGFTASVNLSALDGNTGFALEGSSADDFSSISLSAAGDVNGDGYDDILIGADGTDVNGSLSGTSYLFFGKADGFDAHINLNSLDGATGLRLIGTAAFDRSGRAVSAAGDVNGDGYDDLMVGAYQADRPGEAQSGSSYVIFGRDFTGTTRVQGSSAADSLLGTSADEVLVGGLGDDTLDGAGGSDVLRGAAGDDILVWNDDVRVIDGGSGQDTLRLDGSGINLDLTAVSDHTLSGIERIDLTGSGNNSLTLNLQDVLALPDQSGEFLAANTRQLLIDGNAGDSVSASGQGWAQGANVTVDGASYASYTMVGSAAQLLVDLEVTRTIS